MKKRFRVIGLLLLIAALSLSGCELLFPAIESQSLVCALDQGIITYSVRFPIEGSESLGGVTHLVVLVMVQGQPDGITFPDPPPPDDPFDLEVAITFVETGNETADFSVSFPTNALDVNPAATGAWPAEGQQFYVFVVTLDGSFDPLSGLPGPVVPLYGFFSPMTTCTKTVSGGFNPGDNRINPSPGAWGVIFPAQFPNGDGLHIYRLNPDGTFSLALIVTPEMLATVPEFPEAYVIITRQGDVELAKLPTGQYQLNVGPNHEGKILVTVFDGLLTGVPWHEFTVKITD